MRKWLEECEDLSEFAEITLVASDIDGTLTLGDKITAQLVSDISILQDHGISLLMVTGRSVGWGQALAGYLPVAGVIAENGGVFVGSGEEPPRPLVDVGDLRKHRAGLENCYEGLKKHYPHLRETADNLFRLSDWTFGVAGLSAEQLVEMNELCRGWGYTFTFSSVHCHIMDPRQDKAAGVERARAYLPAIIPEKKESMVTIGDSPNDAPLFDALRFPCSVGVRNCEEYLHLMKHRPKYISRHAEAAGFSSLARLLITQKKRVYDTPR